MLCYRNKVVSATLSDVKNRRKGKRKKINDVLLKRKEIRDDQREFPKEIPSELPTSFIGILFFSFLGEGPKEGVKRKRIKLGSIFRALT
ncbi:hypothetical protein TNCV_4850441 [Trichonephila clavipes]|nr:hypothetical protein TNCV_4850441 [Trichonephila clavipes]